jgi:hypothetical protein
MIYTYIHVHNYIVKHVKQYIVLKCPFLLYDLGIELETLVLNVVYEKL